MESPQRRLELRLHERDACKTPRPDAALRRARLRGVSHCFVNTPAANATDFLSTGSSVSFTTRKLSPFKNAPVRPRHRRRDAGAWRSCWNDCHTSPPSPTAANVASRATSGNSQVSSPSQGCALGRIKAPAGCGRQRPIFFPQINLNSAQNRLIPARITYIIAA